ncbi:lipocalin family protein [Leptospira sp. WS39.C2]
MEGKIKQKGKIRGTILLAIVFLFIQNCNPTLPNQNGPKDNPYTSLLSVSLGSFVSTSRFDVYAERNIDWNRFLGTWNEIRRIDNSFQTGLSDVTATYTLQNDGNIQVINRGISANGQSSLSGVAILPDPSVGKLKVSFLYPVFFGDYLILRIDRSGYQTALIGGPEPNFLWIFSREKTISQDVENEYIQYAQTIGYDTNRLQQY